jgi:hypothetical protein
VGGPGDEAAEAAKQLSVDLETFDSVDELETMGEHVWRRSCVAKELGLSTAVAHRHQPAALGRESTPVRSRSDVVPASSEKQPSSSPVDLEHLTVWTS